MAVFQISEGAEITDPQDDSRCYAVYGILQGWIPDICPSLRAWVSDKSGNQYGWGIAEYSTPEKLFGKRFINNVYKCSPEESYQNVLKQFKKILPDAGIEEIERILR